MRNRVADRMRSKTGSAWSDDEQRIFLFMLAEGRSRRSIGNAIGRSENAVRARVTQCGLAKRRRPAHSALIEYTTARVPHQLVIDWYELGWRVLGIGATDCVLEWRLSRSPEYPHACKVEVSAAPERVLEVA